MNAQRESRFKKDLINWGKRYDIRIERHEDKIRTGVPDLSYSMVPVHGWIETKVHQIKDFDKPLNIPHFTLQQRRQLIRLGELAGHSFLINRQYHTGEIVVIPWFGLLDMRLSVGVHARIIPEGFRGLENVLLWI